jgi:hypothetical protein
MPVINCTQCHETCFINDADIDKVEGFQCNKCQPEPQPVIIDDCLCDECDASAATVNNNNI